MRIINLVENELGESCCEAAHGLSFYVETENHKVLFDAGPNNVILRNTFKNRVLTETPKFVQQKLSTPVKEDETKDFDLSTLVNEA